MLEMYTLTPPLSVQPVDILCTPRAVPDSVPQWTCSKSEVWTLHPDNASQEENSEIFIGGSKALRTHRTTVDRGQDIVGRGQPSGNITSSCVLGVRSKSMKKKERIVSDLK